MIDIIGCIALYFFIGFVLAQGWVYGNPNNEVAQVIEIGGSVEAARIFIFLLWWIYLFFSILELIEFILTLLYNLLLYIWRS